ncbi:Cysteine-rich receptor-like protein kinase 26 [Apostasia shenzhenica]|uniref:Cysteine-rich receptor-like protein kinase 26 n=1 Tax=Apostasia shenzhenica TaxID=1088818 RepID=A0A2I0AA13_9ASPA|nr:Cysteine-rich receptor-like protein kinase 26 [Apostasia shenzhenica]
MSSPPSLLLPLLLLFSLQIISIVSAANYIGEPLFYDCSGNKFTAGSPYASNLRLLFADVITSTPISPNLNFSSNSDGSVFIFAQCRLDAVGDLCAACLNQSIITVGDLCSGNRTASIRYSYCVLRYSDHPFLSVADTPWFNNVFSTNTAANTAEFSRKVGDMFAGILPEAARSENKVAVGSTEILSEPPDSMKIYGLAWCTNDLSPDDCFQCLDHALKGYMGCCAYHTGGGRMTTSCIVTYDDHAMYNETMLQAAPVAAPVAAPSAGETDKRRGRKTMEIVIILAVSLASVLAVTALCVLLIRRRRQAAIRKTESKIGAHEEEIRTVESLHIPLSILKAATYNFSDENKLGEGRFGPVYKGVLTDGRQIVVKRLSNTSCRGLDELRNEAALVAQLQHKNLVKLHGCCMQENEKLLVYEYLSNASLEKHLFGKSPMSILIPFLYLA